jgi:hypothetical protein
MDSSPSSAADDRHVRTGPAAQELRRAVADDDVLLVHHHPAFSKGNARFERQHHVLLQHRVVEAGQRGRLGELETEAVAQASDVAIALADGFRHGAEKVGAGAARPCDLGRGADGRDKRFMRRFDSIAPAWPDREIAVEIAEIAVLDGARVEHEHVAFGISRGRSAAK